MGITKKYFEVLGRNHDVTPPDYEARQVFMAALLQIRRLAKRHHRLAEMDCNGEGVIRGVHYYNGAIDDYARREYGHGVKSAYLKDEVTVFDVESDKIQAKILKIAETVPALVVTFQGEPRGNTVKLETKDGRWIDLCL